jgi:hypothetical protein
MAVVSRSSEILRSIQSRSCAGEGLAAKVVSVSSFMARVARNLEWADQAQGTAKASIAFPQRLRLLFSRAAKRRHSSRETKKHSDAVLRWRCGPRLRADRSPGQESPSRPRWARPDHDQESTMATIGTFTASENGYTGSINNRPIYDGTVGALVDCYFKDPASPYHDIRYNTQRGYVSWGSALKRVAGKRRVSALVDNDLRNWHCNVSKPAVPGKRPRDRLAKAIIQVMRIVLSYGKAAGLQDCAKLYAMIEGM